MKKIFLISSLFVLLINTSCFAQEKVDICQKQDNINKYNVKEVSENYFVNEKGFLVKSCSDSNKIFKVIKYLDNGKTLFLESKNEIIKYVYDENIDINVDNKTVVTFGEKKIEVKDINDFKQEVMKAEYFDLLKSNSIFIDSFIDNYYTNEVKKEINALPQNVEKDLYKSLTYEQKENLLKDKYVYYINQNINVINEEKNKLKLDFIKNIIVNISFFSQNNTSAIKTIDKDILDNNLVVFWNISNLKNDYLKNLIYISNEIVFNQEKSVDEKLEYLEFISKNIDTLDENFEELKNLKIQEELNSLSTNIIAKTEKNNIEVLKNKIVDPNGLKDSISKINEQIRAEFEQYPAKISIFEYNALNDNVKKYYSPEMKKKYINKKIYIKKNIESLI